MELEGSQFQLTGHFSGLIALRKSQNCKVAYKKRLQKFLPRISKFYFTCTAPMARQLKFTPLKMGEAATE